MLEVRGLGGCNYFVTGILASGPVRVKSGAPEGAALLGEAPPSGGFGEQVTVTVVQVPVQVFRDGEPVAGLTEADFEVYDEGERRELSSFEVVDLTETVDAEAAPEAPRSEQAHRGLLVLFDLAFGDPRGLERARRGIAELIGSQLHPADRVGIATYDPAGGARILVGFTADRELLGAALDFLGALFKGDRQAVAATRKALARQEAAADARLERDGLARLSARLGPAAALALDGRLRPPRPAAGSIASGSELAASGLLGVDADGGTTLDPTVSSIVFSEATQLSDSLGAEAEMREAIAATRAFTESMSELVTLLRDLDGQKHLLYLSRGIPNLATQKHVVARLMEGMFQAFRRSGWQVQAIDLRGQPDPFGGAVHALGAPEPEPALPIAFKAESLLYLAKGTGGEIYENFSNVSLATRRILTRTRITYVLSFSVADLPADGRYRKLDVRVKGRAGYRVEHREGYFSPRPAAERSELERRLDEAERLLGDGEGGELEAAAQAFPLRPAGGMAPVPFFVEVAGPSLGPAGAAERRTLRVRAFLLEGSGVIAGAFAHELGIDLQQAGPAITAHGIRFYGAIVAPAVEPRLAPNETRAVLLLLQGAVPKDLAISARVLAADGSPAGGGTFKLLSREPAAGGIQRLLASFSPAGLPPGEYRLEVSVGGGEAKSARVRSEARFEVGN